MLEADYIVVVVLLGVGIVAVVGVAALVTVDVVDTTVLHWTIGVVVLAVDKVAVVADRVDAHRKFVVVVDIAVVTVVGAVVDPLVAVPPLSKV